MPVPRASSALSIDRAWVDILTSAGHRFRRNPSRRGYKVDEVDAFLDRCEATIQGHPIGSPVTVQEVHDVVFRVRFGGYDEWQTDLYLDRMERDLSDRESGPASPRGVNPGPPPIRLGTRTFHAWPRPDKAVRSPAVSPPPNAPVSPAVGPVSPAPHRARHAHGPDPAPHEPTPSVFISYRRSDALHPAYRIYDYLSDRLPDGSLFIDMDTIEIGTDFVSVIEDAVAKCRVLLAVIGPTWLPGEGPSRLDNPNDYVRLEIEAALDRGIPVIPLLIDEAKMPSASDLPPSLAPMTRRQAFVVRAVTFRSDCIKLAESLEKLLAR